MRWFLLVCGVVVLNVSLSAQVNLEILRTHAEQGLVEAQYQLGYLYATGDEGVTQDYAEAARWSQLAADQGHAAAQYNLGYMYATGAGVDLDDAEAIRWYRLAAEQGEARAQYDLGHRYATGAGVPLDTGEAARWWRQAGDQGYRDAQTALEQLDQLSQWYPTTEEDLGLANQDIPVSNDDVLQMVAANLSEGLILSQIRSSRTAFDLSVPEIIRLSNNGVSDSIITAMQTAGSVPDPFR